MNPRLAAPVAAVIAASIAACGGGGAPVIHEDSLRDCLAQHGASFGGQGQGATGYATLFHVSPDLQGSVSGNPVNVFVEKDAQKARADAADAASALRSVGVQDPSANVVANRNVVVVFDRAPAGDARDSVRSCLD